MCARRARLYGAIKMNKESEIVAFCLRSESVCGKTQMGLAIKDLPSPREEGSLLKRSLIVYADYLPQLTL